MHRTKSNAERTYSGISRSNAAALQEKLGKNLISEKKRRSFFSVFIKNLGDPVIRILLGALIINVIFMIRGKDWHEGAGIAVSVILATVISSFSEYKRDSAFERLRVSDESTYTVIRDGSCTEARAEDIVPGDRIRISAGDRIPADCILLYGTLLTNQAPLTGASEEIPKAPDDKAITDAVRGIDRLISSGDTAAIEALSAACSPSDRFSVFSGCFVTDGAADAIVVSTGDKTKLGRISESLADDEKSPLRERLDVLAKQLSIIGYIASAVIALAFLFNSFVIDSDFRADIMLTKLSDIRFVFSQLISAFTLALTVIVVAVPEGLPMMIAVVLSKNSKKMAKDNVLVRHAQGIEAAGCMNILFTDKTGTLTRGEPKICAVITPLDTYKALRNLLSSEPTAGHILTLCAHYNSDAGISSDGSVISKNPAERAILEYVMSTVKKPSASRTSYERFSSKTKYSRATVNENGKEYALIKGAPDILLSRATTFLLPGGERAPLNVYEYSNKLRRLSEDGERQILVGLEENGKVCVVCTLSMKDPLRKEASHAVSELKGAGIHVCLVTGDGKQTAEKIASDCKILNHSSHLSFSGAELDQMTDSELSDKLPRIGVIWRAMPEHKRRLVKIAKHKNLTVGMTGDGLNDAPALNAADCGFALGCGTEVSKNAADVIILDNNLSSVVNAVMHGRNIFKSIRKFITLQLIINFTAMFVSMAGPFIGIDSPVTVVQMLWINIVMDTLGGLAFAGEHAERRILKEKPKLRDEPVIDRDTCIKVAALSIFSTVASLFFLKSDIITKLFDTTEGSLYHLTAFFAFFIFTAAQNCFNARSDRINLFAGLSKNPTFIAIIAAVSIIQTAFIYLGLSVMRTVPLTPPHLLLTILLSLPIVVFEFIRKLWQKLSPRK
jgi:calcium-translocating P-type ATPase